MNFDDVNSLWDLGNCVFIVDNMTLLMMDVKIWTVVGTSATSL